jgi:hypothetical protein
MESLLIQHLQVVVWHFLSGALDFHHYSSSFHSHAAFWTDIVTYHLLITYNFLPNLIHYSIGSLVLILCHGFDIYSTTVYEMIHNAQSTEDTEFNIQYISFSFPQCLLHNICCTLVMFCPVNKKTFINIMWKEEKYTHNVMSGVKLGAFIDSKFFHQKGNQTMLQPPTRFLYKGPGNRNFRLWQLHIFCHHSSSLPLERKQSQTLCEDHACLPIELYLRTLKFEFCILSMYNQIFFFWNFSTIYHCTF